MLAAAFDDEEIAGLDDLEDARPAQDETAALVERLENSLARALRAIDANSAPEPGGAREPTLADMGEALTGSPQSETFGETRRKEWKELLRRDRPGKRVRKAIDGIGE